MRTIVKYFVVNFFEFLPCFIYKTKTLRPYIVCRITETVHSTAPSTNQCVIYYICFHLSGTKKGIPFLLKLLF